MCTDTCAKNVPVISSDLGYKLLIHTKSFCRTDGEVNALEGGVPCRVIPDALSCINCSVTLGFGGDAGKKFRRLILMSVLGSCLFNDVRTGVRSFTLSVMTKKAANSGKIAM